ncbi:MAG: hypothetical protein ACM3SY_05245 [Candidatus Omnitrophota bacterium]
MVKDAEYLEAFERQLAEEEEVDFNKNMEIYEAMYQEAVALGIFPLKDPLDGIEVDIRISRILNRLPPVDPSIYESENISF